VIFVFLPPRPVKYEVHLTGSKENKSNSKLRVLGAFAVGNSLSKTLSGSPFKPPFSRVVVDFIMGRFYKE